MNDHTAPILSVIVPTYREATNVPVLFERLKIVLADLVWEMIVVDDNSPDGTYAIASSLAAQDTRMRCIRRVNRLGLAGAVIEGALSSSAPYIAVIDGDLQHDEAILPDMYKALAQGGADMAIGTRVSEETTERGLSPARQKLSDAGAYFFKRISGSNVSDPMSGFFMIRRQIVEDIAPKLSADGFKILADILLSAPRGLRIVETPYVFRKRRAGESKLSALVAMDFLGLVVHHASAGILPVRFAIFASVGAFGVLVNLAALKLFLEAGLFADFETNQLLATLVATISNFALNNQITYREYRFRGWSMLGGLCLFALVCSVGVIVNIDIAAWLFDFQQVWWVAGFAGALLSVVWNYAVSTSFVWRRRRRS
jgi:dolichol-phosphate mannosyltransferase